MEGVRESGSGAWSEEDEAIIATNTEAAECKRCAVELGYWQDDYIQYFARRGARKPPEINRGYYTRVKLIELFVHQFLQVSNHHNKLFFYNFCYHIYYVM